MIFYGIMKRISIRFARTCKDTNALTELANTIFGNALYDKTTSPYYNEMMQYKQHFNEHGGMPSSAAVRRNPSAGFSPDNDNINVPINASRGEIVLNEKHKSKLFEIRPLDDGIILNTQEKAQNYLNRLKDYQEMQDFLNQHGDESALRLHKVQMERYIAQLNKKLPDITDMLNHSTDSAILEVLRLLEQFVDRMIPLIYEHIKNQNDLYGQLLKYLNRYLAGIGIYTGSIVAAGQRLPDTMVEYYDLNVLYVSDKSMSGVVKEVERLPYLLHYKTQNGGMDCRYINGKLTMFMAS